MTMCTAIHLDEDAAYYIAAEIPPEGRIRVLGVDRLENLNSEDSSPSEHIRRENTARAFEEKFSIPSDYSLALLPPSQALFHSVSLPFSDKKHILSVAPLHIQDLVPFDVDDYLFDSLLIEEAEGGEFEVLTSCVLEADLAKELTQLKRVGFNPKSLTSPASALSALGRQFARNEDENLALISFDKNSCILAVTLKGVPRLLREFRTVDFSHLRCSLAAAQTQFGENIDRVLYFGGEQDEKTVSNLVGIPAKQVTLEQIAELPEDTSELPPHFASVLGLLTEEQLTSSSEQIFDYRQGDYAYKPWLGNFITALKDEARVIGFALLVFLLWVGAGWYEGYHKLELINNAISAELKAALPNKQLPRHQELDTLQDEIYDLQQGLKELGSLSSLSPLDALRQISQAVPKNLDLEIQQMDIRQVAISFQGSVPDVPSQGRLQKALLETRSRGGFCDVNVNPLGRAGRGTRRRFEAELKLVCDIESGNN